ncbi:UDP-glucuronosyltransferase 2C1 isoform X4 [Oryzias melastigma]|uniref:UDP-glucuronosyltransferase 2C1 isoform X4 n=1 Tax=Oryzias melastigma TaxID=30732 RepID=UPI00168CE577|nr:UDP-glucuronosyltransferase 2C1 isoform X4 [Oryzias melastigma]
MLSNPRNKFGWIIFMLRLCHWSKGHIKSTKMKNFWTWTCLFWLCTSVVHAGKVLVFPLDGSHWVNMKVIIEELHSRNHQVTVIRHTDSWYIKENSPFYRSISLDVESGFDEHSFSSFVTQLMEMQREEYFVFKCLWMEIKRAKKTSDYYVKARKTLESIFENKEMLQMLKNSKYDLILTDPAIPGGVILGHYLKLPLVFNVRWTTHGEGHFQVAPSPLSYVPLSRTELSDQMSFFQRVLNVLIFCLFQYRSEIFFTPHYQDIMEEYLGPDVKLHSLYQAADLWLMRVDFVFEFPRPTMPNVVYMGGFQCKPAKPLPDHLEEFVQSSGEHGFIIMSLGTLIPGLPADLAEEIAAAFAELPQKVIWRHKGSRPSTLGNNTLLVDWMPQNDLLGHPKIKLFVSHGGTNGIYEAIYHGVPVVGIPIIFDQADNLSRLRAKGVARTVEISDLDKINFQETLQDVLNEPSYRMNMQKLSRLHRDTPMRPLDTALFWIEFVMRHKGAAHLRTESYKLPWYSYHSVDVMVFLLTAAGLLMFFTFGLLWLCFRLCFKSQQKHE